MSLSEIHELPIGVVSKNDVGDLKTLDNAALKRLRLAIKLAKLGTEECEDR